MEFNVIVSEEGIQVQPAVRNRRQSKLPYTEAELLKGLTPRKAHADELANLTSHEIGE
jgi:hypothetical protein